MLYFLFLRIKNGKQFLIVKYVSCVSFLENKKKNFKNSFK